MIHMSQIRVGFHESETIATADLFPSIAEPPEGLATHSQCNQLRADLFNALSSEENAIRWYTCAVEEDYSEALFRLSLLTLSDPDCTEVKQAVAVNLLHQAISKSYAAPSKYLGLYFRHAEGVPCNEELAFAHYQESAEKNEPLGLFGLAECYEYEIGAEKDPFQAARYFKKAADLGHPEACFCTGMNHFNGTGGISQSNSAALMYFQEVAHASEEVKQILGVKTVAEAEYMLGLLAMLSPNASVVPDLPATYFMRASSEGHALSMIETACYLTFVRNTDDSRAEALTLLDNVVAGLDQDDPFAVLLPQAAGVHPHVLWRLACSPAGEYAYYYENEPPPCEFHASPLWIQDAAPLLKVGLLLLALRPAHPEQHSRDHLLSALHLLQSPLRQVNRTVVCVCDSEKAIEDAYTALV